MPTYMGQSLIRCNSRWHKVNIEGFVDFSKEIGYKLRSSIRDDFLGYSVVAVDLTYECIDDISVCVFLFHRHKSDKR